MRLREADLVIFYLVQIGAWVRREKFECPLDCRSLYRWALPVGRERL